MSRRVDIPQFGSVPETELQPRGRFTFFGREHAPLNLQGTYRLLSATGEHLSLVPGHTVFYKEDAFNPPIEARNKRRIVTDDAGTFSNAAQSVIGAGLQEMGVEATGKRMAEYDELFAGSSLQEILEVHNFPQEFVADIFFWRGMHQLAVSAREYGRTVEVMFESHTPGVVTTAKMIVGQAGDLRDESDHAWDDGRLSDTISAGIQGSRKYLTAASVRDRELGDEWLQVVRGGLKKPHMTGLFASFGQAHAEQAHQIAERLSRQGVIVEVNVPKPGLVDRFEAEIGKRGKDASNVSSTLAAQVLWFGKTQEALEKTMLQEGYIDSYADNYETLSQLLEQIAQTLTYEEIEEICVGKHDLFGVLSAHPGFAMLVPFFHGA
ncbi:MAG: hypothetical protein Q8Q49_02075 [bacterium]|nr:hypothetical protein [bacterium]